MEALRRHKDVRDFVDGYFGGEALLLCFLNGLHPQMLTFLLANISPCKRAHVEKMLGNLALKRV